LNTVAATDTYTGDTLPARISKLAGLLASERYPAADRAALKRHAPGHPPPLAFYRLWLRHLGEEPPDEAQTSNWALITWGLALMGAQGHRADRPLGKALAATAFSEARLERLLAADEGVREDLFASMVRFMSAKRESFSWLDAARLLLTRDADKRELINRRIATDYYRNLPRNEKKG
jgi:CRISPR system Cascade subunit CasB